MRRALLGVVGTVALAAIALASPGCSSAAEEPTTRPAAPDDAGGAGDGAGGPVDGGVVPACIEAEGRDPKATRELKDPTGSATVTVSGGACARTFGLASTADRRDALPASPRAIAESRDRPSLQTKNDLFDALYQLAQDEAKEGSVSSIAVAEVSQSTPVRPGRSGVAGCEPVATM